MNGNEMVVNIFPRLNPCENQSDIKDLFDVQFLLHNTANSCLAYSKYITYIPKHFMYYEFAS